jgi:hypothetical protein
VAEELPNSDEFALRFAWPLRTAVSKELGALTQALKRAKGLKALSIELSLA